MLECVINVSEGHASPALDAIAVAAGDHLLDLHRDEHHNRSVLTMAGSAVEAAARDVATATIAALDLRTHKGAHPRIGVLDVVPFVPLDGSTMTDAVRARDAFAAWLEATHDVPCYRYGPERTLPEVRRDAREGRNHPTAGACAVGARPVLVAYNLWLAAADLEQAKALAAGIRSQHVRALGLPVGGAVQVSCNLIAPDIVGPAEVYDLVAARAEVERAELVGLVPASVLARTPRARWARLDLGEDRTIETRLRP